MAEGRHSYFEPGPEHGVAVRLSPEAVADFGERIPGHRDHWLQCVDRVLKLLSRSDTANEPVLAIGEDPLLYVAQILVSIAHGHSVVCGSPDWTAAQRQMLADQWPQLVQHSRKGSVPIFEPGPYLYLSTGGTGGRLKFARHSGRTISAAIHSLRAFLNLDCLSTVAVLRPSHTGGLMPWLRAFFTGGEVVPVSWQNLGRVDIEPAEDALLSLVPTQLHDLLQTGGTGWSRGLKAILLGGAPAAGDLLARARELRLPLMPCYGMTETAGLVAAQRAADFLAEPTTAGSLLPGNSVDIDATGQVLLRSPALFRGYGDEPRRIVDEWPTGDRGHLDASGRLSITGRMQPWINSGGKKIAAEVVEAAIRRVFPGRECRVVPVPDPKWGEAVALVMTGEALALETVRRQLRDVLPVEGLPRVVKIVDSLPVNERGKTTLPALRDLLGCKSHDPTA